MGKRKKEKSLPPRTKRMNRKQRLQAAPRWLAGYGRSPVVRSGRKRYGVDWLCAIRELQLPGIGIDSEYVSPLRRMVQERAKRDHENLEGSSKARCEHQYFSGQSINMPNSICAKPIFSNGEYEKAIEFLRRKKEPWSEVDINVSLGRGTPGPGYSCP